MWQKVNEDGTVELASENPMSTFYVPNLQIDMNPASLTYGKNIHPFSLPSSSGATYHKDY
jgi:hypothetical protein